MATYTIVGHPMNYAVLNLTAQDAVLNALWNNPVGATVTLTLSGGDDTKVKGHNCLK
jgi:hypothetical protein